MNNLNLNLPQSYHMWSNVMAFIKMAPNAIQFVQIVELFYEGGLSVKMFIFRDIHIIVHSRIFERFQWSDAVEDQGSENKAAH